MLGTVIRSLQRVTSLRTSYGSVTGFVENQHVKFEEMTRVSVLIITDPAQIACCKQDSLLQQEIFAHRIDYHFQQKMKWKL